MKRHCMACGGKLKFIGVQRSQPEPSVVRLRWYKCTQCNYTEWVLCK